MDRKKNIVLKRVIIPEEIEKKKHRKTECVKGLLKRKLGVECQVKKVRKR